MIDFGCGDWQFSQYIDWGDIDYLGLETNTAGLARMALVRSGLSEHAEMSKGKLTGKNLEDVLLEDVHKELQEVGKKIKRSELKEDYISDQVNEHLIDKSDASLFKLQKAIENKESLNAAIKDLESLSENINNKVKDFDIAGAAKKATDNVQDIVSDIFVQEQEAKMLYKDTINKLLNLQSILLQIGILTFLESLILLIKILI